MAKNPKATENTAVKTETPKPRSSEELAFMLNGNYAQIMQCQANINAINKELEERQKRK